MSSAADKEVLSLEQNEVFPDIFSKPEGKAATETSLLVIS